MKKLLMAFCMLLCTGKLFAQQYLQYNTGTLYDSFENPAQKTFIPDSSRKYASNFFLPNFDGNFYLTGDAQQTLKNRAINYYYRNTALQVGNGNRFNRINANLNDYFLMFKMFTGLNGNGEVGFFVQAKATARATFTDEDVALLNGSQDFPGTSYSDVFNSRYSYQAYSQFGLSYREQITKQFAFGIKVGAVSGLEDGNTKINASQVVFDKAADTATLAMAGVNRKAGFSGLPFSNPGISVSIGSIYQTQDGFIIQGNIKDLGFIHWNKHAETFNFNTETTINDLTSPQRENNVYDAFKFLLTNHKTVAAYNTPLYGTAELSASKMFWLDEDDGIKYSPTLIASKELFYTGFTGALVNPVQYKNYVISLVTSVDDMRLFNFGGQFMIKAPNAEFFIGSDKLIQSGRMLFVTLKNQNQINESGSFTGSDLMFGMTFKFGPVIEHPMNASTIPMGEDKGFLGKLWDRIFNPNKGLIKND